jgi:hypothetical protein
MHMGQDMARGGRAVLTRLGIARAHLQAVVVELVVLVEPS